MSPRRSQSRRNTRQIVQFSRSAVSNGFDPEDRSPQASLSFTNDRQGLTLPLAEDAAPASPSLSPARGDADSLHPCALRPPHRGSPPVSLGQGCYRAGTPDLAILNNKRETTGLSENQTHTHDRKDRGTVTDASLTLTGGLAVSSGRPQGSQCPTDNHPPTETPPGRAGEATQEGSGWAVRMASLGSPAPGVSGEAAQMPPGRAGLPGANAS